MARSTYQQKEEARKSVCRAFGLMSFSSRDEAERCSRVQLERLATEVEDLRERYEERSKRLATLREAFDKAAEVLEWKDTIPTQKVT